METKKTDTFNPFARGLFRHQIEIARKMKEINSQTNDEIAAKTGLSIEVVERVMNPDVDDEFMDLCHETVE